MDNKIFKSIAVVLVLSMCLLAKNNTMAEEIQPEQPATIIVQPEVPVVEDESIQDVTAAEEQLVVQADEALQKEQILAQVTADQASRQLVMIGDSRTVGMKSAVGQNSNLWSAKVGMGLSWMKSTGVPAVESAIGTNSDVVIMMGVNDVRSLANTKKYVSYINKKAAEWTARGANVYYVSVNPMVFETSNYPGITNSLIESWNSRMKQGLSADVKYLDTYSQVTGKLSSKDGIHYTNKSYKLIYSLVNQQIIEEKTATSLADLQAAQQLQIPEGNIEPVSTVAIQQ